MERAREDVQPLIEGLMVADGPGFDFDQEHFISLLYRYGSEGRARSACSWLSERGIDHQVFDLEGEWHCAVTGFGVVETDRLARILVAGRLMKEAVGGQYVRWEFQNPDLAFGNRDG